MRTARERLLDILDAIAQIETERSKGKQAFDESRLLQVWMVHHLMIIGESVRSIDPAFRQGHPEVPWRQIAGMRNILVHDYFRINHEVVWNTVERDLPAFREQVETILQTLPPE
jgi:uncharacterized protein with HEPN domain